MAVEVEAGDQDWCFVCMLTSPLPVQYAVPSLKKKDTSEPSSPPHSIRSLSLAGEPHMLLAAHMAAKSRMG